jgi:hypothetical protein
MSLFPYPLKIIENKKHWSDNVSNIGKYIITTAGLKMTVITYAKEHV